MLNEHEGIFIEPQMEYVPEEKLAIDEKQRQQKFDDELNELCDQMPTCESMGELKDVFKKAFVMTKGMKVQQNVQQIYAEAKAKLEEQ